MWESIWDQKINMNNVSLNSKWYIARPHRIPPIDNTKIKKVFWASITKMCNEKEGKTLGRRWIQFSNLNGTFNKPNSKEDHDELGPDEILQRCVMEADWLPILAEAHEGIVGGHYTGKATT